MRSLTIVRRKPGEIVLNDGTTIYRCRSECPKQPPNHWVCWTPSTRYSPAYPTMRAAIEAAREGKA